jgi:hypothetical protein
VLGEARLLAQAPVPVPGAAAEFAHGEKIHAPIVGWGCDIARDICA